MNSVLVDTNVWVDIALKRPDFFEDSLGSVMACVEEGAQIFVVGTSVKDVFYWAERSAGAEAGYRALSMLFDIADVAVVDGPVCKNAVSLERPDYEEDTRWSTCDCIDERHGCIFARRRVWIEFQ